MSQVTHFQDIEVICTNEQQKMNNAIKWAGKRNSQINM